MSVNKVILLGNLGRDPEVRYLDNNRVVANFSVATNEVYSDKKGQKIKQTEWHNIEVWDNLAKVAEKYLKKGFSIYLEGKIKTDSWTDKDGTIKSQKKIRANTITIVNNELKKPESTSGLNETKDLGLGQSFESNTTSEMDY